MADMQVTCINKVYHSNPHEGIAYLGGIGWKWPRALVIHSIRDNSNTFFTLINGKRSEIGIVNHAAGPYLRAFANGTWNDNLLALPECR